MGNRDTHIVQIHIYYELLFFILNVVETRWDKFDLTQVKLDPNTGIFVTMNPAGKGYGGRQKLPDNLKQLFRPVAMTKPDNELIAEVIMCSVGFKTSEQLSGKLVAVFQLSKQ